MDSMTMPGLDEVSRLLGGLEAQMRGLAVQHEKLDKKLDALDERLEPLDSVIADHTKILAAQARHDAIVQKGSGFIVGVSFFFGLVGFVFQQAFVLVLKKIGLVS